MHLALPQRVVRPMAACRQKRLDVARLASLVPQPDRSGGVELPQLVARTDLEQAALRHVWELQGLLQARAPRVSLVSLPPELWEPQVSERRVRLLAAQRRERSELRSPPVRPASRRELPRAALSVRLAQPVSLREAR